MVIVVTKKLISVLIILATVLTFSGCRNKQEEQVDLGQIKGTQYENNYFGLSLSLPKDWEVQDMKAQQQVAKTGIDTLAGEDKNKKALLEASQANTLNLLSISKYPLGTPEKLNLSFSTIAEKVSIFPGIKSGEDYLLNVKNQLNSGSLEYIFPKEIYIQNINNVQFHVLESELPINSITLKQKYYVFIKKGYALGFVLTYFSNEDLTELNKIIQSIKIN